MAEITVIMPVYNVGIYLEKCLDSIINQTFKDFEVICVNDGSTDNSLEILKQYAKKDKRFKVISQKNKGTGIARNTALKTASGGGKFIVFIDPDDWIEENAFEKIQQAFITTQAEVIEFNYNEYNEYSGKTQSHNIAKNINKKLGYKLNAYYNWKDVKKRCLSGLNLYVWSRAYSSDFLKRANAKFAQTRHGEDHIFACTVLLQAKKIYYLNEYLYTYRCRKGSAVNKISDSNFCIFKNIKLLKEYLIKENLYAELKEDFIRYQINTMACHYNNISGENKEKYEYICRKYLSTGNYRKMLSIAQKKNSFLEFFFSIKNRRENGRKTKIITLLGIKFEIKPKRKNSRQAQ